MYQNSSFNIFLERVFKQHTMQWIVCCLSILVYANTIPNKWAYDDSIVITQNRFTQRGINGMDSLLTQNSFAGSLSNSNIVAGGRWRPLSLLFFAVDASVFSTAVKNEKGTILKDAAGFAMRNVSAETLLPHIEHIINILLYALLNWLLYHFLLLLLHQKDGDDTRSNYIAAAVALLFAAHPLHTEVVANIKGRDELLMLLGVLAALYAVLTLFKTKTTNHDFVAKNSRYILLFANIMLFLSLLAKETAVTFSLILPLLLLCFTDAKTSKILKYSLVFMLPIGVYLIARYLVLGGLNVNEISLYDTMNNPFVVLDSNITLKPILPESKTLIISKISTNNFHAVSSVEKLATVLHTWLLYLKLFFVPHPLTIDYYPKHIALKSFADASVIISLLLHFGLLLWAIFRIKHKSIIAFGILFYAITFLPTSNLFFPIGTMMAERFLFMPSLGLLIVVVVLFFNILEKYNKRFLFIPTISAIVMVFAGLSAYRNMDWKDNYHLFSKDVQTSPNSAKINSDFAAECINAAEKRAAQAVASIANDDVKNNKKSLQTIGIQQDSTLRVAIDFAQRAVKIAPNYGTGWYVLAKAHLAAGNNTYSNINSRFSDITTSILYADQALRFSEGNKTILLLQSNAYKQLGKLYGEQLFDMPRSIALLQKADALNPNDADIYYLLGTAFSMQNDYAKAAEYTEKCYKLRPKDRDTKENLAVVYQILATQSTTKDTLLRKAETLLLEVETLNKGFLDNDPQKQKYTLRTLDLLYKNYTLQQNTAKQNLYRTKLEKIK